MGREVRKVTPDWKHPKDYQGKYKPLRDEYSQALEHFQGDIASKGLRVALDDWAGGPCSYEYMLADVDDNERTWLMMYENTSEGTPISPAFETPEELAQWLADTGASAFAGETATYEQWLRVCKGGYAPSAMISPEHGLTSGVAGFS